MISISHWGMFDFEATYRAMTNREKLKLHLDLGLIDERFI